MLAGGVIWHLWENILPNNKTKLSTFYQERCLRIFPLYLYIVALTSLFLVLTQYANPQFQLISTLNNLLIIPLNYYMLTDSVILTELSWSLIPQAWSLGAELQAYLLLPIILKYKKTKYLLLIMSAIIYAAANLNYLHPDYFGYRLIPGVLFIFIIGALIKEEQTKKTSYLHTILFFSLAVSSYALLKNLNNLQYGYAQETLIGLIIGIPILSYANRSVIRLPKHALIGSLAYGVFLAHFLVIWLLDYSLIFKAETLNYYLALIIITLLIAYSGVKLVDEKISIIRRKVSEKSG